MPKETEYWTWFEMSYAEWLSAVNARFERVYLISVDDAGISEEDLKSHFDEKEAPYNYVEWFALKYDLDPKSAFWL